MGHPKAKRAYPLAGAVNVEAMLASGLGVVAVCIHCGRLYLIDSEGVEGLDLEELRKVGLDEGDAKKVEALSRQIQSRQSS